MTFDVAGVADVISQPRFLVSLTNYSLLTIRTWQRDSLGATVAIRRC